MRNACLQQYWADSSKPYRFICAAEMEEAFRAFPLGQASAAELAQAPEPTEQGESSPSLTLHPSACETSSMSWRSEGYLQVGRFA